MTQLPEPSPSADLRDVIGPVWRRRWLVLSIIIVSTVATYVASSARDGRYRSSTQVFVSNSNIESVFAGADAVGTDRTTQDQAKLLLSRPVTDAVRQRLSLSESPATLVGTVSAQPSTGSNFVTVSAERGSGSEAAAVANAYVQAYIRYRVDQLTRDADRAIARIRDQLSKLPRGKASDEQRRDLNDTLRQLQSTRAVSPSQTRQTDLAAAPSLPFSPSPKRDALFAFAISTLLALSLAFGLERFDRRINRFDEVSDLYGVPLLSTIPHTTTPTAVVDGKAVVPDALREPFRELRTHLQLATLDTSISHLAITSAVSGEGKSTLVRNLALTYREWGQSVVVVEADFRRPNLSGLFGVKPGPYGLTSVLTGESRLEDALIEVEVDIADIAYLDKVRAGAPTATTVRDSPKADASTAGIVLLPSGPTPPNPQAVLAADRTRQLIEQLKQRFDIVLIDTPPVLAVSDAMPLIADADGVIVVARVGMTERSAAVRLMTAVRLDPRVQVLGVVANDLSREPGGGYGYGYGYGTYESSNGSTPPRL